MTSDTLRVNTLYIISKGRPQCRTAETMERIRYPGEWRIVCGNNDETLPQYKERWGERVIVFDWYDEITRTDPMDNFGFADVPSGACPVRNVTSRISWERGENRHWQFDDDYISFSAWSAKLKKNRPIKDGAALYEHMLKIAEFGHKARLQNVGFVQDAMEAHPAVRYTIAPRVFNAHNLPSDPALFVPWVGRMNDDIINAVNIWRRGGYEMSLRYLHVKFANTQSEAGGMTDLYQSDGTARKTAYGILAAPSAVKLVYRFGRYHHNTSWVKLRPKLLEEKWRRESGAPPAPPEPTRSPAKSALADKWRKALL